MLEQTGEHSHSTSTGQCFPQWRWIFLFCFINLQMDQHLLFQNLLPCPYSSCQRWIKQSQPHLILYLLYEHVLCKGLLHLSSFSPWAVFLGFFFLFFYNWKQKSFWIWRTVHATNWIWKFLFTREAQETNYAQILNGNVNKRNVLFLIHPYLLCFSMLSIQSVPGSTAAAHFEICQKPEF